MKVLITMDLHYREHRFDDIFKADRDVVRLFLKTFVARHPAPDSTRQPSFDRD
jgi:hypothetical protein